MVIRTQIRKKDHLRQEHKTATGIIPGGLTTVLQSLEDCIDKPFKDKMKEEWSKLDDEWRKQLTADGNVKATPSEEIFV